MVNIAVQVQTLSQHPLVARRPGIEVIGLFYDIASAGVLRVTPTYVETLVGAGWTSRQANERAVADQRKADSAVASGTLGRPDPLHSRGHRGHRAEE